MVDLETLGTSPTAAIIAIGAVRFGPSGISDEFYTNVDRQSAFADGGTWSESTAEFWERQPAHVQALVTANPRPIRDVLVDLGRWVRASPGESVVWGNGAPFDNVILRGAYERAGIPTPWEYWNDRCFRTVAALHPNMHRQPYGVKHYALDDARGQALHLRGILWP
jgi:exodeoxyribonuclease VIII